MNNPRIIEETEPSATYKVPTYKVTDNGIEDGIGVNIHLCKGNKLDPNIFRQEGMFTETLLQVCLEYLTSVNKGDLASRETSMAITKIDEALMWIGKRAEDRKRREVQGTYLK